METKLTKEEVVAILTRQATTFRRWGLNALADTCETKIGRIKRRAAKPAKVTNEK